QSTPEIGKTEETRRWRETCNTARKARCIWDRSLQQRRLGKVCVRLFAFLLGTAHVPPQRHHRLMSSPARGTGPI
ncbi:unnamed protein product, partial [Pylaiella littoralis]